MKVHSPLLRQQTSANRIYGHCPSCGYQLHCIVGGGSGCGRSGGAWKRGRQYSSCLCFMKFLPERKKAETSKQNLGSLQILHCLFHCWALLLRLLRQKQLDLLLHTLELLFFGIRERRVILQRKRTRIPDHSKLLV